MRSCVVALALLVSLASAASPAPEGLGWGTTDSFDLLDLSIARGWAVIKVVAHTEDFGDGYQTGSIDCQYAGMSKQPTSGVTLATWDLSGGRIGETFVVYAAVEQAEECTPLEESQARLAAAKAAATAKGLDVARKPAPTLPTDGTFALAVNGKTVTVRQSSGVREDEERIYYTSWTRLEADGKVLHEVEASYNPMGATQVGLSFTHAFVEGDKVVFVLKRTDSNMRSAGRTSWSLTPALAIGG